MFREVEYMGIKFVVDESVLAVHQRIAALEAALVEEKAEKLWYATRMRTADPMNWHDTNDGTREIYRRDALITLRAKGLLPRESPS